MRISIQTARHLARHPFLVMTVAGGLWYYSNTGLADPAMFVGPAPSMNVTHMAEASTVIIEGRVSNVASLAGDPSLLTQGTKSDIAVTQVLKGQVSSTEKQTLSLYGGHSDSAAPLAKGQYGIFFIKRDANNRLVPTDENYPRLVTVPAVRKGARGASIVNDSLGAVAASLARVFAASPNELATALDGDEVAQRDTPANAAFNAHTAAWSAFLTISAAAGTAPLQEIAKQESGEAKIWAVNALMTYGDVSQLASIKTALIDPNSSSERAVALFGLRLKTISAHPELVPLLGELGQSRIVEVRRGAAAALERNGDEAAFKPLAAALHDSDQMVRYYAASGLALRTHRDHFVPVAAFKEHEDEQLAFWDNWVKSELTAREQNRIHIRTSNPEQPSVDGTHR